MKERAKVKKTCRIYTVSLRPKAVAAAKHLAIELSRDNRAHVTMPDILRAFLEYIRVNRKLPEGVTPEGKRHLHPPEVN